uniref:Zinc finger protein 865 n=1 Tax=Anopheles melas TaxID=34690 RepID=A0A182TMP3_9DIPT
MEGEVILPAACRCCLLEDKDMVYVFDILDEFEMKISDLISRNGAIEIQERDPFSKHICGNCLNDLAITERFVLRCRKTNDLLMNLITSDAQEDADALVVRDDTLSDTYPEDDVSYVVEASEGEAALYEEITLAEGQSIDSSEHYDDEPPKVFVTQKAEGETSKRTPAVTTDSASGVAPQQKKSLVCSYCNKRWISQSALTIHLRTHTGERPFGCRLCDKRFKTASAMDLHERRHSGMKPYACSVCDKRFTEGSNLKVHMLQHTNEKSHVCTVCNRAFGRVFLLQLHMRTHTGEKPYVCEVCGRKFTQQCDLTAHRRIHSGDRPYVCNLCGKSFTKSSALGTHRRSHQKHLLKSADEQDTDYTLRS